MARTMGPLSEITMGSTRLRTGPLAPETRTATS